jgi:hypothetical protein
LGDLKTVATETRALDDALQAADAAPRAILGDAEEATAVASGSGVNGSVSIGKSGCGSIEEFSDAVTAKYQSLYDQGYAVAQKRAAQELIPNTARSIGSDADEFARTGLRDWLSGSEGIQEGPGQVIQVNRRLYDPTGSGKYRIPDVYIPGSGTILDGSISFKTSSLRQIQDFAKFSGGARTTIIAPKGLRWGSYSIIP